jgi:hypothetical protein
MKILSSVLCLAALGAVAGSSQAAGVVEVNFVDAAHYSDAGFGASQVELTTRALGAHLQKLGARLPDGQTLHVDVLDVDLAGNVKHGAHRDLRVMRGGADWPQIRLRYTLTADGKTLKTGTDRLTDLNYQDGMTPPADDPYVYEERLLTRWFKTTFDLASAQ